MNKLHLSAEAQNDLAEIKAYIVFDLDNPTAAAATVKPTAYGGCTTRVS